MGTARAGVSLEFTTDDRKLTQSLSAQIKKQDAVIAKMQKASALSKKQDAAAVKSRRETEKGTKAFSDMGAKLLSMGGAVAVIGKITAALKAQNDEILRGEGLVSGQIGIMKALGQVTKTPSEGRFNEKIIKDFARTTSIGGTSQARAFMQRALSIRSIKDTDFGALKILIDAESDPLQALSAIDEIAEQFKEGGEAGNTSQIMNKLIAGGALSSKTTAEVSRGVGIAGQGFSLLGLGDEEAIGATASLISVLGTSETAGTILRNISTIAYQNKIQPESFSDLISKIRKNKKVMKIIGQQREILGAFEKVASAVPDIESAIKIVDEQNLLAGTPGSAARFAITKNMQNPSFRAALKATKRRGREEVRLEEGLAAPGASRLPEAEQELRETLKPGLERAMGEVFIGAAQYMGPKIGEILLGGLARSPVFNEGEGFDTVVQQGSRLLQTFEPFRPDRPVGFDYNSETGRYSLIVAPEPVE